MKIPSDCSSREGKPMKHECENHAQCMKAIQAILDGEATEEEKEHFRQNMDTCLPCIRTYQIEKSIKESLQDKVGKRACPDGLIKIIMEKITA